MREIKFRVWSEKFKKFETNCFIHSKGGIYANARESIDTKINMYNFKDFDKNEDFIIQQYISLKDKNGTEIYEGDIITDEPNINMEHAIIEWDAIWARYTMSYINSDYGSSEFPPRMDYIKVVGNIFENPELL